MVDDPGQLAMAGGQLPVGTDSEEKHESGIAQWIRHHVTPDAVLSFADRHRWWLWGCTLLFYLAAFNGQWRVQPDAAFYLSVGRNLAAGHGFTYLGQANHLSYPGWPWLIAGCFKVFGIDSLVAVNAMLTLLSLATLAMVYRLFLNYSGRPLAVVMSVGVGLTKAFFCYAFELWSDMPFALGAIAALAGYEGVFGRNSAGKKRFSDIALWIGGLLFAAAMRPTIWPLLAAFGLTLPIQAACRQIKWRTFLIFTGIGLIAAVTICTIGWRHGGITNIGRVYEDYLINRLSGRSEDAMGHPFVANIRDLFTYAASDVLFQVRFGPAGNELLSLIVLGIGFGLFRFRLLWGSWFCLLLATIMASQEALDRYFLPVLPLLVYGWWEVILWSYRTWKHWCTWLPIPRYVPNLIFAGLLIAGCLMNVTKIGGIIIQQRTSPFLEAYDKGTYAITPLFAQQLRDHVDSNAIVLVKAPYGRVLEYLSGRYVTNGMAILPPQLLNHSVYVVKPSDLSTQRLLRDAGLVEGPAVFAVTPPPNHGAGTTALTLHSTHLKKP